MIRIDDPAHLGAALLQLRTMLQLGRRELSRDIADRTGRDARAVNSQLWGWENGDYAPNPTSMGPLLDALGWQLALVPVVGDGPRGAVSAPQAAEPGLEVDGFGVATSGAAETRTGGAEATLWRTRAINTLPPMVGTHRPTHPLAELNQRAQEHAEVCR